jgi:hypothetical protein
MNCLWRDITEPNANGWRNVVCVRCGKVGTSPYSHDRIISTCRAETAEERRRINRGEGPGRELKLLIAQFGETPTTECKCEAMARRMNHWGVEGCERHFDAIVSHLREAYATTNWLTIQRARLAAVTTGLAWEINWLDPLPSLVRLAIERARLA